MTKDFANIAAHNIYSGVAVGGTLTDLFPNNSIVVGSNNPQQSFAHSLSQTDRVEFKGGLTTGQDLGAAVDFAHFEFIAKTAESYESNGFKVVVLTNGGTFNTYDFRNGGQGEDNGKTLVIFNTSDDVTLTRTNDGRQFGPSVIAPFSKVTLLGDAGFIDGFIAVSYTHLTLPTILLV